MTTKWVPITATARTVTVLAETFTTTELRRRLARAEHRMRRYKAEGAPAVLYDGAKVEYDAVLKALADPRHRP